MWNAIPHKVVVGCRGGWLGHYRLGRARYSCASIDTPAIDHVSSSGSRLTGSFDGHANLFGVAAQYKF